MANNGEKSRILTVFTALSAAALFKFPELQMRRSFGGGALHILFVNYNKNFSEESKQNVTKCPDKLSPFD